MIATTVDSTRANDSTLLFETRQTQLHGSDESIDIVSSNIVEVAGEADKFPYIVVTGGSRTFLKFLLVESGINHEKFIEIDSSLNKLLCWNETPLSWMGFHERLELLHETFRRHGINAESKSSIGIVDEYFNSGIKFHYYLEFLQTSSLLQDFSYLALMNLQNKNLGRQDHLYVPIRYSKDAAGYLFSLTRISSFLNNEKSPETNYSFEAIQAARTTLAIHEDILRKGIRRKLQ